MRFEVGQIIAPGPRTVHDSITGCRVALELEVVRIQPERNLLEVRVIRRVGETSMGRPARSRETFIVDLAAYRTSTLVRWSESRTITDFPVYDRFMVQKL